MSDARLRQVARAKGIRRPCRIAVELTGIHMGHSRRVDDDIRTRPLESAGDRGGVADVELQPRNALGGCRWKVGRCTMREREDRGVGRGECLLQKLRPQYAAGADYGESCHRDYLFPPDAALSARASASLRNASRRASNAASQSLCVRYHSTVSASPSSKRTLAVHPSALRSLAESTAWRRT